MSGERPGGAGRATRLAAPDADEEKKDGELAKEADAALCTGFTRQHRPPLPADWLWPGWLQPRGDFCVVSCERARAACVVYIFNIYIYMILCVRLGGGDAGSRRGNMTKKMYRVCSFFPILASCLQSGM